MGETDDLLHGLVRLVQDRAETLQRAVATAADPLAPLLEAVRALQQVIEARDLLDRAGLDPTGASPGRNEGHAPRESPADRESDIGGPPEPREAGSEASGEGGHDDAGAEGEPPPHETARADGTDEADGADEARAFARLEEPAPPADPEPPSTMEDPRPGRGAAPDIPAAAEPEGPGFPPFRDQATGVHSREGFAAVASGELKRCRRHGRLFSLLLFRLPDDGTAPLRRAAAAISAATRESDLLGRSDERAFSVALPETAPPEARTVAERVIECLKEANAWSEGARIALVTHPAHGETLLHLEEAARDQLGSSPERVLADAGRGRWTP